MGLVEVSCDAGQARRQSVRPKFGRKPTKVEKARMEREDADVKKINDGGVRGVLGDSGSAENARAANVVETTIEAEVAC